MALRRRDFIAGMAGSAASWRLDARAQPQTVPIVGYLANATASGFAHFAAAFRRGLGELGYVEGRTVAIDYRWAEGKDDRLPGLVADLIAQRPAVIMATGGLAPAHAAKAATATIPIVFTGGADKGRWYGSLDGKSISGNTVASLGRDGLFAVNKDDRVGSATLTERGQRIAKMLIEIANRQQMIE
jgi:ABC-type uncharacterized transport system substrate-binding protein